MSGDGWKEASISINGHKLTSGQSMTLRVALESMAGSLATEGLGNDDQGKATCAAYMARINEIRNFMYTMKETR